MKAHFDFSQRSQDQSVLTYHFRKKRNEYAAQLYGEVSDYREFYGPDKDRL